MIPLGLDNLAIGKETHTGKST